MKENLQDISNYLNKIQIFENIKSKKYFNFSILLLLDLILCTIADDNSKNLCFSTNCLCSF